MTTKVWVTFQQEGWHCWPSELAPDYLKESHRHIFHFRVEAPVTHFDRELEFHNLRTAALKALNMSYPRAKSPHQFGLDFEGQSCESIGWTLLKDLRNIGVEAVECSEDGECGARCEI